MPAPPSRPEATVKGASVRLLLVEDHSLVTMALASAFETVEDIELVGQAASIREALAVVGEHHPDVVLLDRRLPDGDGINAIGRFHERSPASRVLVFTGVAEQADVDRIAAQGGAGILLKAGRLEDLLDTIRRVAGGQDSFDIDPTGWSAGR